MKRHKILTIAMSAAVLGGASAMAQFNYQNGDLLAAFGNGGSTDVIVDLGAISNFQQPNAVGNSWDLSSVLNSTFGSVNSSMYWAVFGVNDLNAPPSNSSVVQASPYTVWSSLAEMTPGVPNSTPNVSGRASSQGLATLQVNNIANLTGSGITYPSSTVELVPTSLELTAAAGFSYEMNNASNPGSGDLAGTWNYNMLSYGAGTSDFYQNDPGNPATTSATPLGTFSVGPTGVLTFNPVPEPSTWAMIGSGFLALLALRRRK
jgi:hypothetical protein